MTEASRTATQMRRGTGTVLRLSPQFWRSVDPRALFQQMLDNENRHFVQMTLQSLSPDPVWKDQILAQVVSSRPELRSVLAWLAREMQPRTYLEIGVRRGFSMAMVAARCPTADIFGFDLWVRGYAGVENPGPRFVRTELRRVGHRGGLYLMGGNSHRTLPAFFGHDPAPLADRIRIGMTVRHRPATFDLMTVDGDHSLRGAYRDLMDAMPHCAIGGVVVFDDIAPDADRVPAAALEAERGPDPHGWHDLRGVWTAIQSRFPGFRFFDYVEAPPGVGLAVRLA